MSSSSSAPPPQPSDLVMQFAFGYVASACMYVVAELGIADLLEEGPQTAGQLAQTTGVRPDFLYRVLRTAAGLGVFEEKGNGAFVLTPLSQELRSAQPGSLRDMVRFATDPWHYRMYAHAMEVMKTGRTATEVALGVDCFDALAQDPAEQARFNAAMTSFSARVMPAVLEAYDFSGIRLLVDVAGGHGFVLTSILRKYPQMKGKVMDMAHVVEGANVRIREMGLSDRAEGVAGNFFDSVPTGGDAYIMKHIIHDWDDARALTILRNIRKALSGVKDGKVILLEAVVPSGNAPHPAKMLDIEMMMLPGGLERTEEEYRELFRKAGFDLKQVVPTKSPLMVLVAQPD
jgi:hypothetical protein